ncbi:hypothetical protein [Brachybacterium saurashtrense]|uniref:Asp23/Gls24 family envelope stress response protein n=1 Tax=Brachybacterium saurashtrense TaxID=556288 RepID=A0A345YRI7_9MICO|nr:hypothetical protein [Brachybacterium saurashtrense]AXK46539.1 hypothetical protein DWV08_13565 [Brachybacterium saurashtrense]RRR24280.1 hypothetical protein DXU92_05315 [Brachybacterium saurashtrense]
MNTEPVPTGPAPCSRLDVADLVGAVTAVPGVSGLEPGIATTLRTLDARLRRSGASSARYGLVVDRVSGEVTVEIGVAGPLPVRRIVEDVQRTVQRAAIGSAVPRVLVRVQSLSMP